MKIVAFTLIWLILSAFPAKSHEWFVKTGCCDGDDCQPWVPTVQNYISSDGGVTVRLTRAEILKINRNTTCEAVNEFIPKNSTVMKDSPVAAFGICLLDYPRSDGTCVRCLFEPDDM